MASRPVLSDAFLKEHKCIRIMEAAAEQVDAKGMDGAQIGDLVGAAHVARKTFYDCFEGKQDCLEQTLIWVGEDVRLRIVEATDGWSGSPRAEVAAGLKAVLDFCTEHPDRARFYLLHGTCISLEVFQAQQARFAELLKGGIAEESARHAVVGGVAHSLARRSNHFGESAGLDPMLGHLIDFVLAPATPVEGVAA